MIAGAQRNGMGTRPATGDAPAQGWRTYCSAQAPGPSGWPQVPQAGIAAEQAGVKNVRNLGEAFRAPAVVIMATLYFFWGLALFGFVLWLPTIFYR